MMVGMEQEVRDAAWWAEKVSNLYERESAKHEEYEECADDTSEAIVQAYADGVSFKRLADLGVPISENALRNRRNRKIDKDIVKNFTPPKGGK